MNSTPPLVAVIMGSTSDWETMRHAVEVLAHFGVAAERRVVSAHRTPELMAQFAREAAGRGLRGHHRGCGRAPRICRGWWPPRTWLPVLGVPVESKTLRGVDSLLSIVQMPAGVPVGTLAIGAAGAKNAALLAVGILALHDDGPAYPSAGISRRANRGGPGGFGTAGMSVFLPGSTIGVMGGGQLGRMFAMAAHRMGYRVHSFSPDSETPAGQICEQEVAAPYEDRAAVECFAEGIDVLTFEFENVPVGDGRVVCAALRGAALRRDPAHLPASAAGEGVSPIRGRTAAGLCLGGKCARIWKQAVARIGLPAVLKTASFGYDGRGQQKLNPGADLAVVWSGFGQPAVLEAWVPYEKEVSILVARGASGETVTYPVCENMHRNHILDVTQVPARVSPGDLGRGRADRAEHRRKAGARRTPCGGNVRLAGRRTPRQ